MLAVFTENVSCAKTLAPHLAMGFIQTLTEAPFFSPYFPLSFCLASSWLPPWVSSLLSSLVLDFITALLASF